MDDAKSAEILISEHHAPCPATLQLCPTSDRPCPPALQAITAPVHLPATTFLPCIWPCYVRTGTYMKVSDLSRTDYESKRGRGLVSRFTGQCCTDATTSQIIWRPSPAALSSLTHHEFAVSRCCHETYHVQGRADKSCPPPTTLFIIAFFMHFFM